MVNHAYRLSLRVALMAAAMLIFTERDHGLPSARESALRLASGGPRTAYLSERRTNARTETAMNPVAGSVALPLVLSPFLLS